MAVEVDGLAVGDSEFWFGRVLWAGRDEEGVDVEGIV